MKFSPAQSILPDATLTNAEAVALLEHIIGRMYQTELHLSKDIENAHANFQLSIRNLLHYLVLRSEEIRPLQEYLHERGLSSLSSSESHIFSQLIQIIRWLSPEADLTPYLSSTLCNFNTGIGILNKHTQQLLGANSHPGLPHIMVTFSTEMADDRMKIQELLMAGMTVVRINCAHDTPVVWAKMIANLRKACAKTGRTCKLYMDLGGPKIRVNEIMSKNGREEKDELTLAEGDVLLLVEKKPAARKIELKDGTPKHRAILVIQPKGLISMMKKGEHIFFDDGKFEARVLVADKKTAEVVIRRISTKKPILRSQKGVNLPDSDLVFSSLTEEDIKHLPFICQHADMVGYSFVSTPNDIEKLREQMKLHSPNPPAIILKVERLAAVQNLPALIINGMRDANLGVMIARGDLAVEIGFERLSEIQQEILWICEAAHVPVIWATQVLETMNKTGFATRSEISDASMGIMAECVMLNKGPFVVKTVETLADILKRLSGHMDKKRYINRPLAIARSFLKG
jgi:pyruvate kinase